MFQAFIEPFADYLVPILIGIFIWFGIHYVELTPRIIRVDVKQSYAHFDRHQILPRQVRQCVKNHMPKTVMQLGRFEAALYTSSFHKITSPYHEILMQSEQALDKQCGVTLARQAIKRENELAALRRAERIKNEASAKARQQMIYDGLNLLGILMGGG